MIRIYPTLIDSFQYYLSSEMTDQEMINRINRIPQPKSEAAERGTALNELVDLFVLNCPKKPENNLYTFNGFEYDKDIVEELAAFVMGSMRQVKVSAIIGTSFGDVELYGYLDYLNQDLAIDLKSTARYTWPKFQTAFQHKSYLYCLNEQGAQVNEFVYLVTDFKGVYKETYSYTPKMIAELRQQLESFLSFIESQKDQITDTKVLGL